MFEINTDSIFYVICPAYHKTGGTELAHQLVNSLNSIGVISYITYYSSGHIIEMNPAFEIYVNDYKTLEQVDDCIKNVVIAPEDNIDVLKKFKYIQKSIWWMSVDNFLSTSSFYNRCKAFGILSGLKCLLQKKIPLFEKKIDLNIVHLYQSEYAKNFLISKGVKKYYKLSDYINTTFVNSLQDYKKNQILYNPKKGFSFTKEIIKKAPELDWVPIINMTTEQVSNILHESKVYIDFGNHPGKDRFPREAAISGCCIITGKRGSAAYYEDVPIEDEFKFDDDYSSIPYIIEKIKLCLSDYENQTKKFEYYRKKIMTEKNEFEEDVKRLVGKNE